MTDYYAKLFAASIRTGDLVLVKRILDLGPASLQEILPKIFEIELRNTYRDALQNGKLDVLMGLGNPINWQIGQPFDGILQTQAVLNLKEAVQENETLGNTLQPLLQDALNQDVTNPVFLADGASWISVNGKKYKWGHETVTSPNSSITISEVTDEAGQPAVLEVVTLSALNDKGFPTLESWKGYLDTEFGYGVTFKTSSMQHKEVIYTIYEIPEGYHSIKSARSALESSSEDSIFQLISNIGIAVDLTRWADGKFQSIGPSTIYTDLLHSAKIVGLALALASPTYGSNISLDYLDNSPVAAQKYMALLASELIFRGIPKPSDNAHEFINNQKRTISRPFRYVLARMMDQRPERRYPDWTLANSDIAQAHKIFGPGQSATEAEKPLYDFATYLDFRLSITRRTRNSRPNALRENSYDIVERYFLEIQEESNTAGLETLTMPFGRNYGSICSRETKSSLLFVSKMLITLADGYRKTILEDERIRNVVTNQLVPDIILCVLWLEAEALIKGIVLAKITSDPKGFDKLIRTLKTEILALPQAEYLKVKFSPHGVYGANANNLSEVIPFGEFRFLVETFERLLNNPDYDAGKSNLSSVGQLMVALMVLEGEVDFFRDPNETTIGLNGDNVLAIQEWTQSFRSIMDMLAAETSDKFDEKNIDMAGEELTQFVTISGQIRPFERKNGTVLRYNFVRQEGKVRFRRWFRLIEPFFDKTAIGNAPWERYSTLLMPCTVDVRYDKQTKKHALTKISIGPKRLVESRISTWRSKLRNVFSKSERGAGDQIRRVLFLATLGLFLFSLAAAFVWSLLFLTVAVGFLAERLSKWFEFWVFAD